MVSQSSSGPLTLGPPSITLIGVKPRASFGLTEFKAVISSISHETGLPNSGSIHLIGGRNSA